MPDWTAPFKLPTFTDEQFEAQRAKYVAENGYTITIPGLRDIIKVDFEKPMTKEESVAWRKKQWHKFAPARLEELRELKERRREKYMAMLASPTPEIIRNAGSIMTAVDDAQDAISTMAVAGQLARKIAPKVLGRILSGPVGLLMTASDALNLVQDMGSFCMLPMMGKREAEQVGKASPKHRKGWLKKAPNVKKWSVTKGDWIQAAQVTDQVFGFGLSLGPLVGLAQDIVAGSVRTGLKQKVKVKLPVPDIKYWHKAAQKMAKAVSVLWGHHIGTDDDELLLWLAASMLAFQNVMVPTAVWNPFQQADFTDELELLALTPTNVLTREVIEEGPISLDGTLGWPQTNTLWANAREIAETTENIATQNLNNFMMRNKHNWRGYVGGLCAVGSAQYSLGCIEGEEPVSYDYSVQFKVCTTMLKNGYRLDPNQPFEKFQLFNDYLNDLEEARQTPTWDQIQQFCDSPWNDIKLSPLTVAPLT